MIYFVQPADGGPIKIGFTENLDARLKQLEWHYGRPLSVLATEEGGREEEAAIHARFEHLRFGRKEQFRPAPELMAFIRRPLLVAADPDTVEAIEPSGPVTWPVRLELNAADHAELELVVKHLRISKAAFVRMAVFDRVRDERERLKQ